MNLTIGKKLSISTIVNLSLLITLSIVAYLSLSQIRKTSDRAMSLLPKAAKIDQLQFTLAETLRINDFFVSGDLGKKDSFELSAIAMSELMESLEKLELTVEENTILTRMKKNFSLLREKTRQIFKVVNAPGGSFVSPSANTLVNDADVIGVLLVEDSEFLHEQSHKELDAAIQKVEQVKRLDTRITGVVSIAGIIVAVIGSFVLARNITRPIQALTSTARTITEGNFDKRVNITSQDEIGQLADAFNYMTANLKDFYTNLEEKVAKRTKQLSESNRKLQEEMFEHKQAEQELRSSNDFSQTILDSMHELLAVINIKDYTIEKVNKAFLEMYQVTEEDLKGKTCYEITHAASAPCNSIHDSCPLVETVKTGGYANSEHIHYTNDGQKIFVEVTTSPIMDETGKITKVLHITRDISEHRQIEKERRQIQARLRQTQKMEAIGTLAGGIAHDFNNILAALIGYIELTLDDIPHKTAAYDNLEQSLICCNRAKDLVQQILTFSRKTEGEKKTVQIAPVVREALKMLRSSLPATIDIQQNIEADSSFALADPTQIHQIVLNLCTNASHAMGEQGGIMEVNLVDIDFETDTKVNSQWFKQGLYLKLTVSDTGCGMDEATLERIFEPFYTTKEAGKGTGMGLSVVHGIVESHGGIITVSSTPEKGTTFDIFLPRIEGVLLKEAESSQSIPGGTETILLVDDEKVVVDMTKQMLERLGYTVVGKTSPIDALTAFRAEPNKFELVITDLSMPDMSGEQLAKELINIREDIPIILSTGFSNDIDSKKVMDRGIKEFIIKPVTREQIAAIVRNVLDKKEVNV